MIPKNTNLTYIVTYALSHGIGAVSRAQFGGTVDTSIPKFTFTLVVDTFSVFTAVVWTCVNMICRIETPGAGGT